MSFDDDDIKHASIDVFKFKKKSFQQKRQTGLIESDSEDDNGGLLMLPGKRVRASEKIVLRLDLDDDENSDLDVQSKPTSANTIELVDDSSDDEEVTILHSRMLEEDTSTMESIRKAQEARKNLQNAQSYHAEDIPQNDNGTALEIDLTSRHLGSKISVSIKYLDQQLRGTLHKLEPLQKALDRFRTEFGLRKDQDFVFSRGNPPETLDSTKTPATLQILNGTTLVLQPIVQPTYGSSNESMGAWLMLKLRTIRSSTLVSEDEFKIRQLEPFANLVASYKQRKKLDMKAQVTLLFEGEALEMMQTPHIHDMESFDIIEVNLK